MPATFALDPRLAADTLPLGTLELCRVLLFNDSRFPWLILVPARAGLVEVIDLDEKDRALLMREVSLASEALRKLTDCHKLNVAALGNQVRQLHVHVIARFEADAAWPHPVWGRGQRVPYRAEAATLLKQQIKTAMRLR